MQLAVSWCNKLCLVHVIISTENHNNYNDYGGKIVNGSETCAHVY